jgi:hypothetical protein
MSAMGARSGNPKKIDSEVRKITKSDILIDTHNDIPTFTVDGALANMGGVIQININCGFISQKSADAAQAAQSSGTPSTVAPVRQVEKVAVQMRSNP